MTALTAVFSRLVSLRVANPKRLPAKSPMGSRGVHRRRRVVFLFVADNCNIEYRSLKRAETVLVSVHPSSCPRRKSRSSVRWDAISWVAICGCHLTITTSASSRKMRASPSGWAKTPRGAAVILTAPPPCVMIRTMKRIPARHCPSGIPLAALRRSNPILLVSSLPGIFR